ncbi:unnamed protein product [Musa acuminata subsp. malaccensis]|uniref:(wild Malaysian banana) hypothetical protein n=1 Tax=Musa acuminata subsp. malaccensis TaxID=214687 RepID=A0A804KNW3_MUSAM|nr:unnamed protein product [Musa acuminata subsp. malaccensis]
MMRITPNLLIFCQGCAGAKSNQQIKLAAWKECNNDFSWFDIAYEKNQRWYFSFLLMEKLFSLGLRFKMRHMLHLRIYQSMQKSERTSNGMVDCCIGKVPFSFYMLNQKAKGKDL